MFEIETENEVGSMFDTSDLIFNIVVTVDSAQVLDYSGLVDEFNISEEDSPSDVFKFDDDLLQESQIGEDVEIQGEEILHVFYHWARI